MGILGKLKKKQTNLFKRLRISGSIKDRTAGQLKIRIQDSYRTLHWLLTTGKPFGGYSGSIGVHITLHLTLPLMKASL